MASPAMALRSLASATPAPKVDVHDVNGYRDPFPLIGFFEISPGAELTDAQWTRCRTPILTPLAVSRGSPSQMSEGV